MRYFIVATILLVLSILSATAQEPQPPPQQLQCGPPDLMIERIATQYPVQRMVVLTPVQAQDVIRWFNQQPPESNLDFNFVIVLKHTNGRLGLLLGKDGKACAAILIPDESVPGLLQAIMGTGASLPLILVQGGAEPAIHHHEGESAAVDRFYSTWYVPNRGNPRVSSCCNRIDCMRADIQFRSGHWYGHRDIDTNWILIPDALIESNQGDPRESPDGQSHICVSASGTVLCAVLGAGL